MSAARAAGPHAGGPAGGQAEHNDNGAERIGSVCHPGQPMTNTRRHAVLG